MRSSSCLSNAPCAVPPHPDVAHRAAEHFESIQQSLAEIDSSTTGRPLGFNDGTIFTPESFPPNVPEAVISQAAQREPNLRGAINVIVVLVNFKDKAVNNATTQYFKDLFFSQKKISTGSVTEYYADVSGGKISITGDVVGPYQLPQTEATYAHGGNGIKGPALQEPNVRTMANDALNAVEAAAIDLKKYDNKGRADGYVDAFIVVHAGIGGEETTNVNDIWSCKWVLPATRKVGKSQTQVYPFLTIPENAKLGVCAHELGHLLFGWPDLYDVKHKSSGIGNWCLMSGGSWGHVGTAAQGTTPCHPSAWCKLDQEWVDVTVDQNAADVILNEVKDNANSTINANRFGRVHKLWSNGLANGNEYFLIENRGTKGYDASLPGEGLLVWHVDDSVYNNDDDLAHYKVALVSASGATKIFGVGDASNPFPGKLLNRNFTPATSPNSKSYTGQDTFVSVREISDAGRAMKMKIAVQS